MPELQPGRRYEARGIVAKFDIPQPAGGSTTVELPLRTVTHRGGGVQGTVNPVGPVSVTFLKNGTRVLTKMCEFTHAYKDGVVDCFGYLFQGEATDDELLSLGIGDAADARVQNRQFAVAQRDHVEVCEEIRGIQTCRSRMFLATTGSMAVGGFTLAGYYVSGTLSTSAHAYVACVGMLALFGLYLVGVLSMAEKVRAINVRRGFLAALAPYLRGNKEFRNYWGWAQVKLCLADCGCLRLAGKCGLKLKRHEGLACRDYGESTAAGLNSYKKIVPGALDSFTSLSALIFGVGYAVFMVLFALLLSRAVYTHSNPPPTDPIRAVAAPDSQAASTTEPRATQTDHSKSVVSEMQTFCVFFVGALASALIFRFRGLTAVVVGVVAALVLLGGSVGPWIQQRLVAFVAGILLGHVGWWLTMQLYAVRVGKYSFETSAYAWAHVLRHCNPVPFEATAGGATPCDPWKRNADGEQAVSRESGGWGRTLGDWVARRLRHGWCKIVDQPSHERIRAAYEKAAAARDPRPVDAHGDEATWGP